MKCLKRGCYKLKQWQGIFLKSQQTMPGREKGKKQQRGLLGATIVTASVPKTKLRNTVRSFWSVHVLHLLKSDPIGSFIFLFFTERKIKVENRALVLISGPQNPRGNGLGPRRAPHFQQAACTQEQGSYILFMALKQLMYSSIQCMLFIITPEEGILYGNKCAF